MEAELTQHISRMVLTVLTNHGEVDEEGDEECDGGLDEEVEVGLGDGRPLPPVDLAGLDQRGVQVQVVRHYDGACVIER